MSNPITECLRFLCTKMKPTNPSPASTMASKNNNDNEITHKTLKINNIEMHIAEKGEGPIVLFIHGFPDLWYTWRHQIHSIAALGYRAVAPDMRGYGDTEAPTDPGKYSYCHVVGDMVALIEAIGGDRVFVVGHDWGALVAWQLSLFRPDKVRGLVNMSVPFPARNVNWRPLDALRAAYGHHYYICRFQVPGEIEAEIEEAGGASKLLSKFFAYRNPGPLFLPKGQGFEDTVPLPPWMSEEEFAYYVDKYQRTGFTGGLNYYRAINLNWEITAPWTGAQVKVPVKFIVGDVDLTYHAKGAQAYIRDGGMKKDVPLLEEVVVLEGVGHFLQQERPDEISNHIIDFLNKF